MHPPISLPTPRALNRSMALWMFGLCTTLLLVGLWGRSVTADEVTLDESAQAILESQVVHHRIEDWLIAAVADAAAVPPAESAGIVEAVLESPEMDRTIDALVDSTVDAALAPPELASSVDLKPALEQLRPAIDRAIAQAGVPVGSEMLDRAFGDLTLTSTDFAMASGTVARARGLLTQVVVISTLGLLVTGAVAVHLAEHRMDQLRSLCWRIAVSGFTFMLILRLGAWAVDPSGGRSPVAAGSAVILRSNLHVPAIVAVAAVALGGGFLLLHGRRATTGEGDTTGEQRVLTEV